MSALEGIRVLELGRVLAGPWSGQNLADLGADVIKVEHPKAGDDTRGWGPPYFEHERGSESSESAYFLAANRGKRSIAIDFADPQGLELVKRLAAESDVIIENFRVDSLKKYGLDYDSLSKANPKLVYCSITGFGQTGPRRHVGGYDFIMQAMGGLMSVTGRPDDAPGGEPMKVGVPITDLFTGMYATVGILAALNERNRTGQGQAIDISLFDVQIAMLANQGMNYLVGGFTPQRLGNDHPNVVPCGVFPTADGHLVLTIGNDTQFHRLCTAMGLDGLLEDPRYGDNASRSVNRGSLNQSLDDRFRQRSTEDWLADFEAAKVPAAPVNTVPSAFADIQSVARGLHVEIPASYGKVPTIASPLRLSRSPVEYRKAPPLLGEHTREILTELLDVSEEEMSSLAASRVIRGREPRG
jgi:crotonobetainyl-CoA:carnitine CoA-transferase CaiB-like acyl-CoA transferase